MKLWNELPTKLRVLPKSLFKNKIKIALFNILESEDLYDDFERSSNKSQITTDIVVYYRFVIPFLPNCIFKFQIVTFLFM